jgi:hypothetical protein
MLRKFSIILFCSAMLLLAGCSGKRQFDREGWNLGDGITFPSRDAMLDDLLQNHKLKGLKYQEVIHLLHRPQLSDQKQMMYEVTEVNKPGKPRYIKQLILSLKDSIVTNAKIYEHTDKKK